MRLPSYWPERGSARMPERAERVVPAPGPLRKAAPPAHASHSALGWLACWLVCWIACWTLYLLVDWLLYR
jgi:hypothetical protein